MNKIGIALLAKAPVAGEVKTRFTPPCSPEQAADFARAFLKDTAAVLADPRIADRSDAWSSYLGKTDFLAEIFGDNLLQQRGQNFGERIGNATEDLFAKGYEATIAFAADCPTVDVDYLESAFNALAQYDVVFGPANDGGCVIVALAQSAPEIFSEVEMSTDHVYDDMVVVAESLGLTHTTLPLRHDLDTMEELLVAVDAGELNHAKHTLDVLSRFR